jgi:translation initiation factor 1A
MVKSKSKSAMKHASQSSKCLIFADGPDQDYGLVTASLGDGRFRIEASQTGATLMGIMRGNMRRRAWISVGAVVLFSQRTYQESKVDILHVYTDRDVAHLQRAHAWSPAFQASLSGTTATLDEEWCVFSD